MFNVQQSTSLPEIDGDVFTSGIDPGQTITHRLFLTTWRPDTPRQKKAKLTQISNS